MQTTTDRTRLFEILSAVSVLNRDYNGRFTVTDRLDRIAALLQNGRYRRINTDGLFHLYASAPLEELRGKEVLVVSAHVDCEYSITRCFFQELGGGMLKGTFDNAVTNAAVLYQMLYGDLPGNVLIAFTGDEEYDSTGAIQLGAFLSRSRIRVRHIFVLDVTYEGWSAGADFTVENDYWEDDCGEAIAAAAERTGFCWRFVPCDLSDVPGYVSRQNLVYKEADADESEEYCDDYSCCSLCLPVEGEMHSDEGVLAREASLLRYVQVLGELLRAL